MAAWLTWLKSRLLLPQATPETARAAGALVDRLAQTERVRALAAWLGGSAGSRTRHQRRRRPHPGRAVARRLGGAACRGRRGDQRTRLPAGPEHAHSGAGRSARPGAGSTPDDVGDVSEISDLLDQIDGDVASLTADGAYDGEAVYDAVAARHPEAAVIIPPRTTAVRSETTATQRDQHIATIEKHGRIGWQCRSGYNRRSLVETGMYRYKTIVGRRLHTQTPPNQRTEAKIGCDVLNRMTGLGMPATVRIR
jgi:hypothetical protein